MFQCGFLLLLLIIIHATLHNRMYESLKHLNVVAPLESPVVLATFCKPRLMETECLKIKMTKGNLATKALNLTEKEADISLRV